MQDDTTFDHQEEDDRPPSKSQIKREMTALQSLGEALVELSDKQLATIPVPEQLLEQIALVKRIKHNSGKRRQMQYIGKIMREIDVEPIQAAFEELQSGRKALARQFHRLEQWRDRLLEEGNDAIEALLDEYPQANRQQLRQLVRLAQKEQSLGKAPTNSRKLFRYIKEIADLNQEN